MGLRGASVGSTTSLLKLVPNTDLVPLNFPSNQFTDTPQVAFGIPAATLNNTRTYPVLNNNGKVRQDQTFSKINVKTGTTFTANKGNLTAVKLIIYERDGGGLYDEVHNIDILTAFTALTANDTVFEIDLGQKYIVKQNQIVAIQFVTNGTNSPGIIRSLDGKNANSTKFLDGILLSTNVDFEGTGTANDAYVMIQLLGFAPWGLWLGDSLGEDEGQDGYWDNGQHILNVQNMISNRLQDGGYIGKLIQNSSLGATSTAANVFSDIQNRVLDMKPKVCFVAIGTNDVAQGTSQATFETNYTSIINTMISNDIVPILIKIIPRTDLTEAEHLVRESFNDFIQTIGEQNKLLVIDLEGKLGQRRDTVQSANLWDILTSYNLDDTHLNTTGQAAFADEVYSQFIAHEKAVQMLNAL